MVMGALEDSMDWLEEPDPFGSIGSNNFQTAQVHPSSVMADQPDDSSIVRTTDLNGIGHGAPRVSGYRNSADLLATNAAIQHQNALDDLKKALMAQPNTSPQQGIAAALLAAVPTVGGALIGNAIGRPQLPAGAYGVNMNNVQLGAGAGMAEGAKVGGDAATQYLKSLDTSPQEKAIALQKAQWEEKQGDTFQQQSDQFNMKDLEVQQGADPIAEKQKIQNIQDEAKARAVGTALGQGPDTGADKIDPVVAQQVSRATGMPIQQASQLTNDQLDQLKSFKTKGTGIGSDLSPGQQETLMKTANQLSMVGKTVFNMDAVNRTVNNIIAKPMEERTAADSVLMIEAFGRSINPNSNVLRQGAIDLAKEAAPTIESYKGEIQGVLNNTGKLTDKTYQQMADAINGRYQDTLSAARDQVAPVVNFANAKKVPLEQILPPSLLPLTQQNVNGSNPMSEDQFIQKFLAAKAAQNGN